jgi:hypothetical protein
LRFGFHDPKSKKLNLNPKSQNEKKEITNSRDHLMSYCHYSVLKHVVPYVDSWLAASRKIYFSTEYHNSRQNMIIIFSKYLVDIRSELC